MPYKILLVEDDAELRETLAEVLQYRDYEVTTAEDGARAFELLDPADPPRLILLDLMMPRMNGWLFNSLLRQKHEYDGVAVVLLSSLSDVEVQADATGAAAVLSKPVEPEMLLATVDRLLVPTRAHTAHAAHSGH